MIVLNYSMQENINITKVQLNWCLDILERIRVILKSKDWTDEDKLVAISWLVKQALKVEREE
jgi:hypothetical protein